MQQQIHGLHISGGERFPHSKRGPRYPMTAPAELLEPVSRHQVTGSTTVISETGCHIRSTESLSVGTIVQLRIDWQGTAFQVWARVAHSEPEQGMGLAFFDVEPAQRVILKEWLGELVERLTAAPLA